MKRWVWDFQVPRLRNEAHWRGAGGVLAAEFDARTSERRPNGCVMLLDVLEQPIRRIQRPNEQRKQQDEGQD